MTEKTKHTPGPWKTDELGIITGGADYCTSICTTGRHFYAGRSTFGHRWAEQPHIVKMRLQHEANARLIAAAPETKKQRDALLEAIQQIKILNAGKDHDIEWLCVEATKLAEKEG